MSHAHADSQDNFQEAVDSEDDYVVDCEEMIIKRDETILELKGRMNIMGQKLKEQEREITKFQREHEQTAKAYDLLKNQHFKNRKRLLWYESREDDAKQRERRKRWRLERHETIAEEARIKVRAEEEEREKIRFEKLKKSSPPPLFTYNGLFSNHH